MGVRRSLWLLPLALSLIAAGCGRPGVAPRPSVSIEPLPITQPRTGPFDDPSPTARPSSAGRPSPSGSVSASQQPSPADDAAVKQVIEQANNSQSEAFAQHKPELMRPTAVDNYYEELAQINGELAAGGVTAIKLLKIEWGSIAVSG